MRDWMTPVGIIASAVLAIAGFAMLVMYQQYGTSPWDDWKLTAPGMMEHNGFRIETTPDVKVYVATGPNGFRMECYSPSGCQYRVWAYVKEREAMGFK